MISLLVAMDKSRVIGINNKLPWHLPADLKRFKQLTMGHMVVMGRKTFESIRKPLPGRTNVIVTRQAHYQAPGCRVVHSLDAGVMTTTREDGEVFIIGGAELFNQAIRYAEKLYITEIDMRVERGDTFFPEIDLKMWRLIDEQRCQPDEKNPYHYKYLTFIKKV